MEYTLQNNITKLTVDTYACEIHSFKRLDKDLEYMWQGDPNYWTGRNPILFPHVLATENKILNFKGKDYKVGNHGFLRRSEFNFISQSDNELVFNYSDNENTLKEYPYHFNINVRYVLNDNKVTIYYEIKNTGEEDMPYGFGLHPAFNCPLVKDKKFEDYKVIFNKDEDNLENKTLPLTRDLFKKYPTFYINELHSNKLVYTDGTNSIKMGFNDFTMFGLWTCEDKPADYVCLEPWLMEIDKNDLSTPFEQRKGVRTLKVNETFKINYTIEII